MASETPYPTAPSWLRIPAAGPLRPVTGPEIVQMEANGCTADDWAEVQVPDAFAPDRVRRVHFGRDVRLGHFAGTVDRSGVPVPAGVYDAHLSGCVIGDGARVSNVSLMHRVVVGEGALVADCDEVLGSPDSTFGNGIRVGLHTANADRSIPVVADLLFGGLAALVRPYPDAERLEAISDAVKEYLSHCRVGKTVIGAGARVSGCRRIKGAWIGAGCTVSGATTVTNVTLLSDGDDCARIGAGAIVRNSILQWNAVAEDGAFVENSFLAEASTVTCHGIVTSSAIGPNTTISEGEVSSSVVGPFTGFNHQALLVSACWPEGRGNVGYGANVGSNHTGRAPDQEIHPGEGAFFGLGVNIKMPADFSAAPYTIIATGVDTAPQLLGMPFSLIVPGAGPDQPNRLFPGWGLSRNMYGITRNFWKFSSRNRAKRTTVRADPFSPAVMRRIHRAHQLLSDAPRQPVYSDRDVFGLGANVVQRKDLEAGREAYRQTLRWYALREFVSAWGEAGPVPLGKVPYLREFVTVSDPAVLLELFLEAERARLAAILTSKARDDSRGGRTIEDYVQVHTPAGDDPLYLWAQDRFEEVVARVGRLKSRV